MPLVPSWMEDSMCWEIDYKFAEQHKKAQELRATVPAGNLCSDNWWCSSHKIGTAKV